MPRWIWILLALAISTSVYFTIRYGLRPRPVPIMSPTAFETFDDIGTTIYKRLRQNIRSERIVLLGSNDEVKGSAQMWSGLIKAALADREKLVVFYPRGDTADGRPGLDTVAFDEGMIESGAFMKKVKDRLQAGHLVLVEGLTRDISHFVDRSLSHGLDREVHHPVLAISTLRFIVDDTGGDDLDQRCLDTNADRDGLQRLDCAARRVSRKFAKKKLAPDKIWAVMERHGLKEYLLFVYEPPASAVPEP